MEGFKPFNLANALGNAEQINTSRLRNSALAEASQPNSRQNQLLDAQLTNQLEISGQRNSKIAREQAGHEAQKEQANVDLLQRANQAISDNPQLAQQIDEGLKQRGVIKPDFTRDYGDLQAIQAQARQGLGANSPFITQQPVDKGPQAWQSYTKAKQGGYPGSFLDYQVALKEAGKNSNTTNNIVGGFNQPTLGETGTQTEIIGADEGAPVATPGIAPWSSLTDPKKIDDAKIKFYDKGLTYTRKLKDGASAASKMNNDLDRFTYLNKTNYTGGIHEIPGSTMARAAFDSEFAEMNSIASKLTPQMRQGLPGSASDTDTRMFRDATVGGNKSQDANANVAKGLKIANNNAMDYAEFMGAYLTTNRHLAGAESKWKAYLEANPIFDPKAEAGSYTLNESRQTYKEFFADDGGDGVDAEYEALAKKHGL